MKKMMLAMAVTGVLGAGMAVAEEAATQAAVPALPMMEPVAKPETFSWADVPAVVAKIGDQEITQEQLKAHIAPMLRGGELPADAPKSAVMMLLGQMTQELVRTQLLEDALKANGLAPLAESARTTLTDFIGNLDQEQRKEFDEQIAAEKLTLDEAINKMLESPGTEIAFGFMALAEKLGKDVKPVTADDAKKYYEENIAMFTEPGTMEVAHILLQPAKDGSDDAAVKAKIDTILAEVRANPESFADKAKAESSCGSAANGGDLGMQINKDTTNLDMDFLNAALPLKQGEISDVVKTQFGYHIIKCLKKTDDVVTPLTPELQASLAKELTLNEKRTIAESYMKDFEAKNKPEIFIEMPQMPMQMQMR